MVALLLRWRLAVDSFQKIVCKVLVMGRILSACSLKYPAQLFNFIFCPSVVTLLTNTLCPNHVFFVSIAIFFWEAYEQDLYFHRWKFGHVSVTLTDFYSFRV